MCSTTTSCAGTQTSQPASRYIDCANARALCSRLVKPNRQQTTLRVVRRTFLNRIIPPTVRIPRLFTPLICIMYVAEFSPRAHPPHTPLRTFSARVHKRIMSTSRHNIIKKDCNIPVESAVLRFQPLPSDIGGRTRFCNIVSGHCADAVSSVVATSERLNLHLRLVMTTR